MLPHNPMRLKLLVKQGAECKEDWSCMPSELDCSRATKWPENLESQSKIIKMVDPLWCWGGAKELDKFLETLSSHCDSNKHLFPRGDSDQVISKITTHPSWLVAYVKPRTGAWRISKSSRTSFKRFTEIKIGASNQRQAMQEYHELPIELDQVYADRLNAKLRWAGWNLITHEVDNNSNGK